VRFIVKLKKIVPGKIYQVGVTDLYVVKDQTHVRIKRRKKPTYKNKPCWKIMRMVNGKYKDTNRTAYGSMKRVREAVGEYVKNMALFRHIEKERDHTDRLFAQIISEMWG